MHSYMHHHLTKVFEGICPEKHGKVIRVQSVDYDDSNYLGGVVVDSGLG